MSLVFLCVVFLQLSFLGCICSPSNEKGGKCSFLCHKHVLQANVVILLMNILVDKCRHTKTLSFLVYLEIYSLCILAIFVIVLSCK